MRHYPPRQPRTGGHWTPGRDRATQAQFRARLILEAGGLYCQRCGDRGIPIQAHHDSPDEGRLLCRPCHKHEDPHAR